MTEPEPEGTQDDRISRVESKIDQLASRLASLIPTSRAEAQEHTERRLERPTSVEEQVQAELSRAREKEARDRERAEGKQHREATEGRLKKLEERAPEPAPRGIEKVMGWRR